MHRLRTLFFLLFSFLTASNLSASVASRQLLCPTRTPNVASVTAVSGYEAFERSSTRSERRFQRFLRRVGRVLQHEGEENYDTTSIVAMILGVVGLASLLFFPYLMILCVPGLILGIVGLRRVKHEGTKGYGFAIAGIVTGALGILLALTVVVAALVIFSWLLK